MGMYTEFSIKIKLREDVPEDVKNLMSKFFNSGSLVLENRELYPATHSFWSTPRYDWFSYGEYVHPNLSISVDLKNYDNEIEKFLDWISPYVESANEGVRRYEEDWEDTIIVFDVEARRFAKILPVNRYDDYLYFGCTPDEEQQEPVSRTEFIPHFT